MRIRVAQAVANIAVIVVFGLAMPTSGQGLSCCSTNAETQLLLSEVNFREVTVSNAVQYLCEQTEKEHGVKLKMDFDANPPEVHISLPSGLGDDRQRVEEELKKQVGEQVARFYVPPRIWGERRITLSLRNVPVCVALEYIVGLSDAEITCRGQERDFTLGHPQVVRLGRMYRIRTEAW